MLKRIVATTMFAAALSGTAWAQPPAVPPAVRPTPNDYADAKSWLCRPGGDDACVVDLTTTVLAADGTFTRESWAGDAAAPIDCFYVYPTVSSDPTPNSDMIAGAGEQEAARQQFARFGSACRLYAPLYRQVTVASVRNPGAANALLAYEDVRDAWNYYLQHDNKGRGFVLIGHSQGATILRGIIRREIDGKPVQAQLISAILPGTAVAVPPGKDVGGAFQHVPLCRSASQLGCAITYSSFRATAAPDAGALFGRPDASGMPAGCTNPAALGSVNGGLRAYFDGSGEVKLSTTPSRPWVSPGPAVATPFVSAPGLLTARCASNSEATYLEVTVHGDPSDPRTDDISGDLRPGWGLHLIDVNLAIGNLIDIVAQQAKAYAAKASSK